MVETNLELVDLTLKGLLDAEGLALGLLLSLQGCRHGLHGAGVVLPAHDNINNASRSSSFREFSILTWCC